jgi:hypothetical protein
MNFKILQVVCGLLGLLFYSCQGNEPASADENVEKIKFDPGKSVSVDLRRIADSISFKILSDNKGFNIGDFDKVLLIDSLIIIPQYEKGEILIFDLKGEPKLKMELLKPGPGQILSMSDVYLNRETKTIEVLDKKITKIFSYDLNGRFLKEVRISNFKMTGFRFAPTKDLYVFERISSKKNNDRLGIFDKNLKYIRSSLQIPQPILKMNYVRQHVLEVYKNLVYYLPLLENKIYSVSEDGAKVAYEFDVPKEYQSSRDFLKNKEFNDLGLFMKVMMDSKIIINTDHLYITDDIICFSYKIGAEWKKLIYSKHSGKVIDYTNLQIGTSDKSLLTAPIIGTDGEHFAYLIHTTNNHGLPVDLKKKLGQNSNPVLLCFKLKKF